MKTKCYWCNKSIEKNPCELRYSKNVFCNRKCHDLYQGRKKNRPCFSCEKTVIKRKFCDKCLTKNKKLVMSLMSKKWYAENYKNENDYRTTANGYLMAKVKDHPYKNKRGYVYIHRRVMEKKLGRYLTPIEVVHHKDGDKMNNKISNLVLFRTTADHTTHHLLRGEVGNPKSWRNK